MGFEFEKEEKYSHEKDISTLPKLFLYNSFLSKIKEPLEDIATPPLKSFASIPFEWEEAPGKPRTTTANGSSSPILPKSKTVRCLVPPPRLMKSSTSEVTNMPSPTTVLDGPYGIGGSLSLSSRKSFRSLEGQGRDHVKDRFGFGSRRGSMNYKESRGGGTEGITDISSRVRPIGVENDTKLKSGTIRKRIMRRSSSFLSVSATSTSNLLSSIYGSFKQAVPWKRMPEKQRRMSS